MNHSDYDKLMWLFAGIVVFLIISAIQRIKSRYGKVTDTIALVAGITVGSIPYLVDREPSFKALFIIIVSALTVGFLHLISLSKKCARKQKND